MCTVPANLHIHPLYSAYHEGCLLDVSQVTHARLTISQGNLPQVAKMGGKCSFSQAAQALLVVGWESQLRMACMQLPSLGGGEGHVHGFSQAVHMLFAAGWRSQPASLAGCEGHVHTPPTCAEHKHTASGSESCT